MIVDLTLTISQKLPSFPGSPTPQFLRWADLRSDGYNLELMFMSSHSGTHIDAPFHFAAGGKTVEQIPLGRLVRDAIIIKIPKKSDCLITKNDLILFENKNGTIPDYSTVVFYTGWQKNILKKNYFTNNPGLSKEAARYLVSKQINLVGIDSPSIDVGTDQKFSVHRLLSKNNILIVENLANLQKITKSKFSLTVLPLKLKNASGSPVRAVGIYSST